MTMSSNGDWGVAWIDDGYELNGYLAGRPRLHPPVEFTARPLTQPQRSRVLHDQQRAKTPEEEERIGAATIATHLLSWDVTDRKGDAVPISEKSALRLHPMVFLGILQQISGVSPPDAKPDGTQETSPEGEEGN